MRYFSSTLLFLLIFSCNHKEGIPNDIIKPEKMQLILSDFIKSDVYTMEIIKKQSLGNDTVSNLRIQQIIFNHYKISRNDFYKSYQYYYIHPELMVSVLDSITKKLDTAKPFQKNMNIFPPLKEKGNTDKIEIKKQRGIEEHPIPLKEKSHHRFNPKLFHKKALIINPNE